MTQLGLGIETPLALSIDETAQAASLSRSTICNEIRYGRLKTRKFDRATRIMADDLRAWMESRPTIKPQPHTPRVRRGR